MRNFFGSIFYILSIIGFCCSILLGIYVGFWLMFVGGITDFVNAVQKSPVEGKDIAISICKVMFAGLSGWISVAFASFISWLFVVVGDKITGKANKFRGFRVFE